MTAVYKAIQKAATTIGEAGIAKDRRNTQQNYQFRGIDDVYNALNPILCRAGLVILPRVVAVDREERATQKGGVLIYTRLRVEYDFVAVEDGSKHTAVVVGEAMDSADKSSNKAMSAAYKYALMQVLCIPTEGDNDADATTHEPAPRAPARPQAQDADPFAPDIAGDIVVRINKCATSEALKAYRNDADFKHTYSGLDDDDRQRVIDALKARAAELGISVAA